MFTNQQGVFLASKSADCPIILIFDPISRVIASIHSGRKGTEKNIVAAVVNKLRKTFDLEPKNLLVYICPSASFDFYLVSSGIAYFWEEKYKKLVDKKYLDNLKQNDRVLLQKYILDDGEVFLLDIKGKITDQLLNLGVKSSNIETSTVDTIENTDYNSYRRGGQNSCTSVGFIMLN